MKIKLVVWACNNLRYKRNPQLYDQTQHSYSIQIEVIWLLVDDDHLEAGRPHHSCENVIQVSFLRFLS